MITYLVVRLPSRSESVHQARKETKLEGIHWIVGKEHYYPFQHNLTGNQCVIFIFQNPEAPSSWDGTRNASIPAAPCPQVSYVGETEGVKDIFGSEDCLYLNVFTNQVSRRHVFGPPKIVACTYILLFWNIPSHVITTSSWSGCFYCFLTGQRK